MLIDLIAAIFITYGFYRGYSKGLIKTVVDALSILVGLVIALKFSPLLISYLQQTVNLSPSIEFILGFLIVFFVVILILRFIADRIEDIFKAVKINFINQLAGGVLLGFLFTFCLGAFLLLLTNLSILPEPYTTQSTLYEHLIAVCREGTWVFELFKDMFTEFWEKFQSTIDRAGTEMAI
jgi:membrane protein required for colicin V production